MTTPIINPHGGGITRKDLFWRGPEIPVVHNPQYGVAFQDWLRCQLEGFSRPADRSVALDVGAHEGKFFQPFVGTPLLSIAILFEPHPVNAARLRKAFHGVPVTIEEMAVSSASGTADFSFGNDTATGSLLQPTGSTPAATEHRRVKITSLDDYACNHNLMSSVNVLKIDTQGADFRVLNGSEKLLQESQPILVVELCFAQLYEDQGGPAEIISWLAQRGYRLAGFFDEHFSRQGWLSWCDACFLPVSRMGDHQAPFAIRQSRRIDKEKVRWQTLLGKLFNNRSTAQF